MAEIIKTVHEEIFAFLQSIIFAIQLIGDVGAVSMDKRVSVITETHRATVMIDTNRGDHFQRPSNDTGAIDTRRRVREPGQ